MKDIELILSQVRKAVLDNMDPDHPLNRALKPDHDVLLAWWHHYIGALELAFDLGLISEQREIELSEAWRIHHPAFKHYPPIF